MTYDVEMKILFELIQLQHSLASFIEAIIGLTIKRSVDRTAMTSFGFIQTHLEAI